MPEELQIRVHGQGGLPTVIYLPGLHGDWTLIGGFRKALQGRARFVEFTYPRSLTWSLEDYAAAIEHALQSKRVAKGWLVGESFGSQVVWPLVSRGKFDIEGVVLAGGFVRHPALWLVRLTRGLAANAPSRCITTLLFGWAKVARLRFRKEPEVLATVNEFIARRTQLDLQAVTHRLQLIAENDPCAIAREARVPVYAITGFIDPVVPWHSVRKWLKANCPALREYRIIRADHVVLSTASRQAAEQIMTWISSNRQGISDPATV